MSVYRGRAYCRYEDHTGVGMFRSLEGLQVRPRMGTELHYAGRRSLLPRVLFGQFSATPLSPKCLFRDINTLDSHHCEKMHSYHQA